MTISPKQNELSVSEIVYGDSIVIRNKNTTIGYAHFSAETKQLDYLYVNPLFRRKGYGRKLVNLCEQVSGTPLHPQPPISKLGRLFFNGLVFGSPSDF